MCVRVLGTEPQIDGLSPKHRLARLGRKAAKREERQTMVNAIDKFLIKLDFDREELVRDKSRHYLYAGIGILLLVNVIFIPLAIIEIL